MFSKFRHWNNAELQYLDKHNRLLNTTLLMVSATMLVCVLLFATGQILRFESSPNRELSIMAIGPHKTFHTEQVGKPVGMWRCSLTAETTAILFNVRSDYLQSIQEHAGIVPQLNHDHRLTNSIPFTFHRSSYLHRRYTASDAYSVAVQITK